MPSLSGGESYALARWRAGDRSEGAFFAGWSSDEPFSVLAGRPDIVSQSGRAWDGQSQQ